MKAIASNLFRDSQQRPSRPCPTCGGCTYAPTYQCIRCQRERP